MMIIITIEVIIGVIIMMIIVIAVVLKAVVVILIVTVIILAKVIIIIVTKTAWAINTILGTRILYSGHSACVDPEVKRSRSHSYNNHHGCSWRVLLRPLPAWVCMPIRLPMFSSYKSVIEEFWRKAASHIIRLLKIEWSLSQHAVIDYWLLNDPFAPYI